MSFLKQYIEFLKANRKTHCCKKLWQCFIDMLEPIVDGKSDKYYFDEDAGLDVIEFIQGEIPDLATFNEWMESVPPEFSNSNLQKVKYLEKHDGKFLGFIRQLKGEWADLPLVLELFQKAIDCNPNYALAYFNLARGITIKGDKVEAAKLYQTAQDINKVTQEIDPKDIADKISELFES